MAGERTEKATPKRRAEARRKGQVVRSAEVNTTAVLASSLAVLAVSAPTLLHRMEGIVSRGLAQSGDTRLATEHGLGALLVWAMGETARALAPVVVAAAVAGIVANWIGDQLTESVGAALKTLQVA